MAATAAATDVSGAVQRLRTLSAEMHGAAVAERDARVKAEVQALLRTVEADDRNDYLDRMLEQFPVWPPDVKPPPPPPPLTDEEMVLKLAHAAQASDAERQRITGLLRNAGIGGGLSEPQQAELKRFFSLPANAQPDLNRVIEVLRLLARVIQDVENASRDFLKQRGVVFSIGSTPRMAETIQRLLPLSDAEGARHARTTELENAKNVLLQAMSVLRLFCPKFAEELAEKFAPSNIEATGGGLTKYSKWWEEYVNRWGGVRDKGGVRAEIESRMNNKVHEIVRGLE